VAAGRARSLSRPLALSFRRERVAAGANQTRTTAASACSRPTNLAKSVRLSSVRLRNACFSCCRYCCFVLVVVGVVIVAVAVAFAVVVVAAASAAAGAALARARGRQDSCRCRYFEWAPIYLHATHLSTLVAPMRPRARGQDQLAAARLVAALASPQSFFGRSLKKKPQNSSKEERTRPRDSSDQSFVPVGQFELHSLYRSLSGRPVLGRREMTGRARRSRAALELVEWPPAGGVARATESLWPAAADSQIYDDGLKTWTALPAQRRRRIAR
jgi:hypothetical protein